MAKKRVGVIFGSNLRRLRNERGWTLEDLADAAGLTSTYVGQVERGQRIPSLTVVLQFAGALNIVPGDLLAGFSRAFVRALTRRS